MDHSQIKKGNGSEKQNVLKTSLVKKQLKAHFEQHNRMPKLHWTKWNSWCENIELWIVLSLLSFLFLHDWAPKKNKNVLNNVLYFKQVKKKRPDNTSMDRYMALHWQDSTFNFDPRRHAYLWLYPHLFAAFKRLKFSSWLLSQDDLHGTGIRI